LFPLSYFDLNLQVCRDSSTLSLFISPPHTSKKVQIGEDMIFQEEAIEIKTLTPK
jgi:hypothetical protein